MWYTVRDEYVNFVLIRSKLCWLNPVYATTQLGSLLANMEVTAFFCWFRLPGKHVCRPLRLATFSMFMISLVNTIVLII